MNRRNLLLTIGLAALSLPLSAQTFGSVYDPQLNHFSAEGRVPLTNILSATPNILQLPPEVLGAINAGALEMRARVDFNRGARIFRLYYYLVPPSTPYPLPAAPDPSEPFVGAAFDISIEEIRWFEWKPSSGKPDRRVATVLGRRLGIYKGTAPLAEEPAVLQFGFERDNPNSIGMITISFAGEIVVAVPSSVGQIEFDPPSR